MRGWMAAIRRTNDPFRLVHPYGQLRDLFLTIAVWDEWHCRDQIRAQIELCQSGNLLNSA